MKRRASLFIPAAIAVVAGLSTSSCALLKPRPAEEEYLPRADARSVKVRIAQVSYGAAAQFRVCFSDCPVPTQKTRASAVKSTPVADAGDSSPDTSAASAPEQRAPLTPVVETAVTPPARRHEEHVLVNFVFGSADLTAHGRAAIDAAVPYALKAERIVISGRTDSIGNDKVNDSLAFARALAVRDHIREQIPDLPNVIAIDAKGHCCFVAENDTAEGRAKNRRVEVVFMMRS
jgi:outer membrane protein OmpA-like peptidoglycan-associated protein